MSLFGNWVGCRKAQSYKNWALYIPLGKEVVAMDMVAPQISWAETSFIAIETKELKCLWMEIWLLDIKKELGEKLEKWLSC